MPFEKTREALDSFQGVQRRFTVRGQARGVLVVDDFGHHPAEVKATLAGARAGFADRRILCAFQPHRFSRTRDLFDEFAAAFDDADEVFLCDVFAAGEPPIPGIDTAALVKKIREHGHRHVTHIPSRPDIAKHLAGIVREGDVVVACGAGDIQLTCGELLTELGAGEEATKNGVPGAPGVVPPSHVAAASLPPAGAVSR